MGTVLTLAAYAVAAFFLWRVVWRFYLWFGAATEGRAAEARTRAGHWALAAMDVLLLRRLFLVNKGLWAGEWLFHVSFVLVVLRHLRYFLEPVPGWVVMVQPLGVAAGYVLSASLAYILVYRLLSKGGLYVSRYNLALTVMLLLTALTGLIMRGLVLIDLVEVKWLVMQALALSPVAQAPGGAVFVLHWALALAFVAAIPSHIMTAPQVALEARRREDETRGIMHDE